MKVLEMFWVVVARNRIDLRQCIFFAAASVLLASHPGCTTPDYGQVAFTNEITREQTAPIVLREGDVLRITFPGAPNLNVNPQYTIRRDGRITLPLVGEVTAAGKTPADLEKELMSLYSSQLVMKEVNVSVEASTFSVYVTGAVLRPGRVDSNRPISALEAIMEAGGVDYTRANLKAVTVSRTVQGRVQHFSINLKRVLEGKSSEVFQLAPSDIVYVPERFVWF